MTISGFSSRFWVAVVVVMVVVVAACGGDGAASSQDDASTSPSAADGDGTTVPDPVESDTTAATTSTIVGRDDLITSTTKPGVPTETITHPDVTVPEGVDPYRVDTVVRAIDDLAERLEVDQMAIGVIGFEEVVWRDGSMGCPQPGMSYTQALVDGMLIVLTHADVPYQYHQGGGGEPFLCENPSEIDPGNR